MKKKIAILSVALMVAAAAGVASAATAWGKYKGYDIIRLTVDGKEVKASDAPAISFNNRTMVPIYMLKDAGVNYSWNGKTNTVEIKSAVPQQVGVDIVGITKKLGTYSVQSALVFVQDGQSVLSVNYLGTSSSIKEKWFIEMLKIMSYSTEYAQINFSDGSYWFYPTLHAQNYINGATTLSEFMEHVDYVTK